MLVLTRKPDEVIWLGSFIRIITLKNQETDPRAKLGLQIPEELQLYSSQQLYLNRIELPPLRGLLDHPLTMEQAKQLPMRTYHMSIQESLYIGPNFEIELKLVDKKPSGQVRFGITAHKDMVIVREELLAQETP